jgi:hypothetical protein
MGEKTLIGASHFLHELAGDSTENGEQLLHSNNPVVGGAESRKRQMQRRSYIGNLWKCSSWQSPLFRLLRAVSGIPAATTWFNWFEKYLAGFQPP